MAFDDFIGRFRLAGEAAVDIYRYNASGQLVSGLPGESFSDSAEAFATARSGRVTTIVLGGFQVSSRGAAPPPRRRPRDGPVARRLLVVGRRETP